MDNVIAPICDNCSKVLTREEFSRCLDDKGTNYFCFECDLNNKIQDIAFHLREAHITFEEVIRKLLNEVDK